ncbi:MAG: DUF202 domain-containing protein [Gordonia sp. (in: high G+C Gram-positive bacteria)]|uniref:DUF202 domain-containing protein n=1 Tax=Gordonia TaxID=2053 RepID=UPI003263A607
MPDTAAFLFDAGAQNERTRLAWTRMALAFMAGAAMLFRTVPNAPNPAVAALPAAICLAVGVWLMSLSHGRYRHNQRALKAGGRSMPDGVFLGVASAACVVGGMIAVGLVFLV